jgi:hypothetical protein
MFNRIEILRARFVGGAVAVANIAVSISISIIVIIIYSG